MIEINLLPKEMRKARGLRVSKSVLMGAGAVAGILLLLAVLTAYQGYRLHDLDDRIADVRRQADKMRDDIMLVDRLVDVKSKILARLAAIDELDQNREQWVRVLNELSTRVPDFLWLTSFRPTQAPATSPQGIPTPGAAAADSLPPPPQRWGIEGYAFTLNGLANFMIELHSSDFFSDIGLDFAKIEELEKQNVYTFSLNCRVEEQVAAGQVKDVENQTPPVSSNSDQESPAVAQVEN